MLPEKLGGAQAREIREECLEGDRFCCCHVGLGVCSPGTPWRAGQEEPYREGEKWPEGGRICVGGEIGHNFGHKLETCCGEIA